MQQSYYIFDDEGEVIAIFKDEAFARDYLYHLGISEDQCKIGILSETVFMFDQHDAKYHTFQDSSLQVKSHNQCRRFVKNSEDTGLCFLTNELVGAYDRACSTFRPKK